MKVVEIRGYQLGFAPAPAIGNARTMIRRRDFMLVELVADTGARGWGEVFSSPAAAAALVRTRLSGLVLGASPHHHGRLYEVMLGTLGYDRRGPGMMAISALDMALHDLAAQDRGTSVAEMLGGALRGVLPAYASAPFITEAADPYGHYQAEVDAILRRGFRAVKPRAGVSPRADGAMALAMRRQVGPDVAIMVDINQGYTARAAIESARRMEEADLLWIEEPVQAEDIPGYAAISAAVPTAIAGGEALGSLAAFRDVLAAGAMSVLQPDLTVCGGYTGFLRIAALAAAYDLPVMPHVFGTVVNMRAALQAAALVPARRGGASAYPWIEYDASVNPLLDVAGALPVRPDGTMEVPVAPGTGLDLQAERLAPWVTETWRCNA
ncbi:mandelate racemase/muconate lactonizing enzyme family protein [Pseudoroseomonas wenyumeiae]|uniref:Mandelate racemase/muconate lactonizing enzyme family protein n=1 Tax=Teichococcus wenyumeiae TaxID=2478470 RepID=A0A3A9J816_9PROT|nr:mandelate racemase/muconate lactonizing enzyme family protein [Pseudoroseomonas wenyumeiae]RMI15487.1 mandelate racemase/muconate lactonizing enzyme family protein [Pseudoroseomonas wenyumeiae]